MRRPIFAASLFLALGNFLALPCLAQSENTSAAMTDTALPSVPLPQPASAPSTAATMPTPAASPAEGTGGTLSRIGVGIHMSTLGPGADVAFNVAPHINIRGGFNYFGISESFTNEGTNYSGSLKLESGEAHLDYFFWRGLHLSPGLLFSNGDLFSGTIKVPGGQKFTLSGTKYMSDPEDPVGGTGALKFNTVAPTILFGCGNLVPSGNHRFSVRFEVGGAFRGSPSVGLNFTGSVCTKGAGGEVCQTTATDTAFQSSVTAQEHKFNNDISFLKFYPIISIGFGFKL